MRLLIAAVACLTLSIACTVTSAAPVAEEQPAGVVLDGSGAPEGSGVRLIESIQRETYAVRGSSAAEVRSDLNQKGPYSPADGRTYDAVTRWGLQWGFRYKTTGGACSLEAATIELVIVTELPVLTNRDALDAGELMRWDHYIASLTAHEEGHVEAVQRGARSLQRAFHEAPAMASCLELGSYLTNVGRAYEAAMRAADTVYDRETGHGRTQEAVFP